MLHTDTFHFISNTFVHQSYADREGRESYAESQVPIKNLDFQGSVIWRGKLFHSLSSCPAGLL